MHQKLNRLRVVSGPAIISGTGTLTNVKSGLQLSTPKAAFSPPTSPPWLTAPTRPYVRAGVVLDAHITPSTGNYYFECAVGDGVTAKKVVDLGPGYAQGADVLELEFNPYAPSISMYLNGTVLHTETDTSVLPQFGGPNQADLDELDRGAGVYLETGDNATNIITQGFFTSLQHAMLWNATPATLWY